MQLCFLDFPCPPTTDTLLNVFLAIAVDNLANAQSLTEDEEREKKQEKETGNDINANETGKSKWKDVGDMTKTLAVVNSWQKSDEEPGGDQQGENGING